MNTPYCPNISFLNDTLKQLPLQIETNAAVLQFDAATGLYQFTAIADGSTFDWESLYIDLELFGNKGQRTGPWDFDLTDGNRALMPSFWVELDGERLGLWYFQRVSRGYCSEKVSWQCGDRSTFVADFSGIAG